MLGPRVNRNKKNSLTNLVNQNGKLKARMYDLGGLKDNPKIDAFFFKNWFFKPENNTLLLFRL